MMRNRNPTPERRRRYWRITLWSVVLIVVGAMALPLTGYLYVGLSDAYAQSGAEETNPRANYWRAVREGQPGSGAGGDAYSSVTGRPMPGSDAAWLNREADNLINGSGQNWRQIRNRVIAVWGGWILFGLVVVMLHFYAIVGRVKLEDGAVRGEDPALDGMGTVRALGDRGVVSRARGHRLEPAVRPIDPDSDHGA